MYVHRMAQSHIADVVLTSNRKRGGNKLLLSLSTVEWGRLQPHLERVELKLGATLYEMGDQINWVVFPEQGLLSLISLMVSGRELETSVVVACPPGVIRAEC